VFVGLCMTFFFFYQYNDTQFSCVFEKKKCLYIISFLLLYLQQSRQVHRVVLNFVSHLNNLKASYTRVFEHSQSISSDMKVYLCSDEPSNAISLWINVESN